MRHKSILYPVCRVDLVELEPGESFTFSQKAASASYGVFALGGNRSADDAVETTDPDQFAVTTMTSGAVPGRMFNHVGKWLPNTPEAGWSNDGLGHEAMTITAGEQGASWICLVLNGATERAIEHIRLVGSLMLPPAHSVLVLRGSGELDGLRFRQLDYMRPRALPCSLAGEADLLIMY
jgi:hypothetical protein